MPRKNEDQSDSTISTDERYSTMDGGGHLEGKRQMEGGGFCGLTFGSVVQLIMSIVAAYLNWSCLQTQSLFMKVITSIMAFFFAIYYLIFYLIFKIILGQTC